MLNFLPIIMAYTFFEILRQSLCNFSHTVSALISFYIYSSVIKIFSTNVKFLFLLLIYVSLHFIDISFLWLTITVLLSLTKLETLYEVYIILSFLIYLLRTMNFISLLSSLNPTHFDKLYFH